MNTTKSMRNSLYAGTLAGLLMAFAFFVDYGPGANLPLVARWFGLNIEGQGRLFGFVLLIVLGALVGLLFGVVLRNRALDASQVLLAGVATGVVWWLVLVDGFGVLIRGIAPGPFGYMLFLVLSLVYGIVLASLYLQFQGRTEQGGVGVS